MYNITIHTHTRNDDDHKKAMSEPPNAIVGGGDDASPDNHDGGLLSAIYQGTKWQVKISINRENVSPPNSDDDDDVMMDEEGEFCLFFYVHKVRILKCCVRRVGGRSDIYIHHL